MLDAIDVDDATGPGVQQDPKVIAMPATQIGVGGAAALKSAHPVEATSIDDRSALKAADARIHRQAIAEPIGLRIPEAAEVKAEPVILAMAALVTVRVELPLLFHMLGLNLGASHVFRLGADGTGRANRHQRDR